MSCIRSLELDPMMMIPAAEPVRIQRRTCATRSEAIPAGDSPEVSLTLLRSFCRTVERGTVSHAAKDLNLSQPTISRHLSLLEQIYGTTLLVRSTRALNTTRPGQAVYEHARDILWTELALVDDMRGYNQGLTGHLNVSSPLAMGTLAARFSADFMRAHPGTLVNVRLTDSSEDLITASTDVAIRAGHPPAGALHTQHVAIGSDVLVCSPKVLAGLAPPTHPCDLQKLPWIVRAGIDNPSDIRLRQPQHFVQLTVLARLSTDQLCAHRFALLAGAGVGLVDAFAVQDDLKAGRLVEMLPSWRPSARAIHLLRADNKPRRTVQSWAEAFMSYLRREAGFHVQALRATPVQMRAGADSLANLPERDARQPRQPAETCRARSSYARGVAIGSIEGIDLHVPMGGVYLQNLVTAAKV
jgi:DNA-binding transcriptional LysR family regulator